MCTSPRPLGGFLFVAPVGGFPLSRPPSSKMEEGTTHPLSPVRVLQKVYGRLLQGIQSPEYLAGFVYSEELIGDEIVSDLPSMTNTQAKTKLLSAFKATLQGSEHQRNVMERFCVALESTGEPVLKDIAEDIRLLCRGLLTSVVCVHECMGEGTK